MIYLVRPLCITDVEDVSHGHIRTPHAEGRMNMEHRGYPTVLTRAGVHTSPMDVTRQNTEASMDNRSPGEGARMTGDRSLFVGGKRSFATSGPSKLDEESSHDRMTSGVARRHSFFYKNHKSKK